MPPIDYADYHRTVIGYHGTSAGAAARLVDGDPFAASDEDNEWFGRGVYFWEHAFQQAWQWARRKGETPAVVGAILRLGFCFDLLDPANVEVVREAHRGLLVDLAEHNKPVPVNVRSDRRLDCAVFNHLFKMMESQGRPVDTARGVFVPASGRARVFPGSWISEEAHIQIGVRNPRSILAVWHVREDGRYGKTPGQ